MNRSTIIFMSLATIVLTAVVFLLVRPAAVPPETPRETQTNQTDSSETVTIVVEDLEIPWDIAFLPEGGFLVTERPGRLIYIADSGERTTLSVEGVLHRGESGLLGIVLHPRFNENRLLYLYLTAPGTDGLTENRVEQYRFEGNILTDRRIIIDGIPGAVYHDGGRMAFGPDGLLYITTGDATSPQSAQDRQSLAGKILRLNDDGSIPPSNPFGNAVYSYGHRNPQGLTWDEAGRLWETEHGRSGVRSGLDEVNLITPGGNYGWPESEGDSVLPGTIAPAMHSGANDTWAPASAAIVGNSLFFGGLRGEALYEVTLNGGRVGALKRHFYEEFGRIRTVHVGPDGFLYLTTSNRDGRGDVRDGDDKIIRIDVAQLP